MERTLSVGYNDARPPQGDVWDRCPRGDQVTELDLKAVWAYLRTLRPIKQRNKANELSFPFDIRYTMLAWRWMFFRGRTSKATGN